MTDNNQLEKIGEAFGDEVVALVMSNRAFTVTILEVTDTIAYVTMTGGTEKIPVPLTGINIIQGTFLKTKPTVGSLAVVQFADSAENQPFFIAFSDVDSFSLTVGDSTVTVTNGIWKFNGGTLGGLTITPELKTQLDKLTARVDAIDSVLTTGANGAGTVVFAGMSLPTYLLPMADPENFDDIENEKIKQ